jgi:hypothetical protein
VRYLDIHEDELDEATCLLLQGLAPAPPLEERQGRRRFVPRELLLSGLGNEAKVLDLPVRGRRLRDWLPPSYDEHVWDLRYGGHVEQLHARLSRLGDIPLGAKLSIGKDWYEKCKAEEAWDSNDDTRVATLLMEAQLDMLEGPFASIASLGAKPPTTRAERIEHLADFFEMMMRGQRRLARMERLEEYRWGFIPAPPPQPAEGGDRASAADIYVPPALR